MAQAGTQFPMHAAIIDPARLCHERERHRRQFECDFLTAQARRTRQPERVGDSVKIVAHPQIGIIHRVVHSATSPAEKGEHRQPRKIVRMDVVRIDIVLSAQHRVATANALKRQAFISVNAGRPQNADLDTAALSEGTQLLFSIDASLRPRRLRPNGPGFIDMRAAAVTVNPCRAYVYEVLW